MNTPERFGREDAHFFFLQNAANLPEDQPGIYAYNTDRLEYPSRLIAQDLAAIGALRGERAKSTIQGSDPTLYRITDSGRHLLAQLELFYAGELSLTIEDTQAIRDYWATYSPYRLAPYYINAMIAGQPGAIFKLNSLPYLPKQNAPELPGYIDPAAAATIHWKEMSKVPATLELHHCAGEVGQDATLYSRLNALEVELLDTIGAGIGTTSQTYIVSWLLMLGALVVSSHTDGL